MEMQQLFAIAPSFIQLSCTYDWRFGWSARIAVPAPDGVSWLTETYGPCSAGELVDAASAALEAALAGRTVLD